MLLNLSHKLSPDTPFWDGLQRPRLERLYDLDRGDVCNSFYLTTNNHAGTHVDGPYHFDPAGRRIGDYDVAELTFTRPCLVDLPLQPAELVQPEHVAQLDGVDRECDILLLRSGFGAVRGADPKVYVEDNPGFSRRGAEALLAAFPALRALAVDFISIAATRHAEAGCDAHRVLLGCAGYNGRPVLLVEDVKLPPDLVTPQRVLVVPWQVEGLDSAPCTVLAEVAG